MIGGMLGVCSLLRPVEEEAPTASFSSFAGSRPGLLHAQVQGFSLLLPNHAVKTWPWGYPELSGLSGDVL